MIPPRNDHSSLRGALPLERPEGGKATHLDGGMTHTGPAARIRLERRTLVLGRIGSACSSQALTRSPVRISELVESRSELEDQATITQLLERAREGDGGALDQVAPLIYDELHAMARRQLRKRRPGNTLDTTALVHDAYLKLLGGSPGIGTTGDTFLPSRRRLCATSLSTMPAKREPRSGRRRGRLCVIRFEDRVRRQQR